MFRYLAPAAISAVAALLCTPGVMRAARRAGVVSHPRQDRWFHPPVPLLGGVAIWLATLAAAAATMPWDGWHQIVPVLLAGCGAFGIGVVDDLLQIKPATKLTGQIAVGCLAIAAGLPAQWSGASALDALITVAWFVAITNAFNLLDNMDGLCAGVGAIVAMLICFGIGDPLHSTFIYSAALCGGCLGFLVFNFRPASIFMGDSGSLFIGSSLALLALDTHSPHRTNIMATLGVPVLLLMIPIFDILFVTLSRQLSARSATTGGRDHTSHRLVGMGFSERQAVLLLYGLSFLGGISAVALQRTHVREANVIAGLLVVGLVLLAVHLARVRVYDGDDFVRLRERPFTAFLVELTYKRRIFEVLLDSALVTLAYYGAYVIRFDRDLPQYHSLLVTSLPIVIACQLISFFVAGVYRGMWHYFTSADAVTYVKAVLLGLVSSILALLYLYRFTGYSRSVFLIDGMALLLLLMGSRYTFRLVSDLGVSSRPGRYRVLVYGAGEAGALLAREVRHNPRYDYQVIGFVDDDASKAGKRLAGLPVLGGLDDLAAVISREAPDFVVVSTTKIEADRLMGLSRLCYESGTGLLQFEFALKPLALAATPGDPWSGGRNAST